MMTKSPGARKTAVIGATGYIGRHLLRSYRTHCSTCIGTGLSRLNAGLTAFDLRAGNVGSLALADTGHEAVVVAAGTPGVAWCESHPSEAAEINLHGPLKVAEYTGRHGMWLIYLSSDYVFDGRAGNYEDDAQPSPCTEYGRLKAAFERRVGDVTDRCLTVRLSKVYGTARGDGTLLDGIAADLIAGRVVSAAQDQFFCPTHIDDVVRIIGGLQARNTGGIVNVASPETWSRAQMALALCSELQINVNRVQQRPLHQIAGMEGRPLNTTLACLRLQRELAPAFMPMQQSIRSIAYQWSSSHNARLGGS